LTRSATAKIMILLGVVVGQACLSKLCHIYHMPNPAKPLAIVLQIVYFPQAHLAMFTSILRSTLFLSLLTTLTSASAVGPLPYFSVGDSIPVSCLERHVETGEHITNDKGELQYVPFPTCNETGRPLELYFGIEKGACSEASDVDGGRETVHLCRRIVIESS
jgi:hypothetical protein